MPTYVLNAAGYAFSEYAIPTMVMAAAFLLLGTAVLVREGISRLSMLFFLVTLTGFVWLFAFSWMYSSTMEPTALWWAKAAYLGIPFIPSAIYHFTVVILRVSERCRTLVRLGWVFAAIFSAAALSTNALVSGLYHYWWGYYPRYGWLSVPYLVFFFGLLGASLRRYWIEYQRVSSNAEKSRIKAFTIAFAVGASASIDYAAKYGVPLYPFGYIPLFGFLVIVAYAIWYYRLTPAFVVSQILETMQGAVFVTDLDGRIRVMNPSARAMLKYRETELLDRPIEALFDSPAEISATPRRVMRDRIVPEHEAAWRTKTGRRIEVSLSASVATDDDGLAVGIVYSALDITERVQARRELLVNEETYRLLFERNPHPMWVYDRATLAFLAVNQAAVCHYGYSREEFLAMTIRDIRPPQDRPALPDQQAEEPTPSGTDQASQGPGTVGLRRHRKKDGSVIEMEITASPIRFRGNEAVLMLASDGHRPHTT